MSNGNPDLVWEVSIPLVTNPLILKAWTMAMGATYLLVMLILGTVFIGTGQADQLPLLAGIFAIGVGVFMVLGLLVMLLVYGNRYRARFTLTHKGIAYEGVDRRARGMARLAVVAGVLGASARTTGAGLLAISQERVQLRWSGAFTARYLPHRHTIVLRNQWRDIMHVYCTSENYGEISDRVNREIGQKGTELRHNVSPSPLPSALLQSLLVVAACMPLYALVELTDLELMIPLILMLFALTIVWLIPLFAWIVLPIIGYIVIHIAIFLGEFRQYTLINTYSYRKYEVLDFGEWLVLAAALVSLVYLGWISVCALRGRLNPVLFQDMEGMG
jgi:hypothetical protein